MAENIHRARSVRLLTPCPDCKPSTRPGLLWMGGNDWVECPTCDPKTPGMVPVIATEFKAMPKRDLVADRRIEVAH